MKCLLANHVANLVRHCDLGDLQSESKEGTLTLIGSLNELIEIKSVEIGDYTVEMDHIKKRARHRHHSDPAIPFPLGKEHCLQIFLFGEIAETIANTVCLTKLDGNKQIHLAQIQQNKPREITHEVTKIDERWILKTASEFDVDLVIQTQTGGEEHEERHVLPSGHHEVALCSKFSERLGVCLSHADDPFGGIEYKHNLFGEVGATSGRKLWSKDRIWHPPTLFVPAYNSMIVDLVSDEPTKTDELEAAIKHACEVELIASKTHLAIARNIARQHGSKIKITKVGDLSEDNIDIAVLEADQQLPSNWTKPISFLLFRDQNDHDFVKASKIAIERLEREKPVRAMAIEKMWLEATQNAHAQEQTHGYGISWSISSANIQRGGSSG